MPRRLFAIALYLLCVLALSGGVWWVAYTSALTQVSERGRSDLGSASERLIGQLERFRQVAVQLADHPVILALTTGEGDTNEVAEVLLRTADQTGSLEVSFVTRRGTVLASSQDAALGQGLAGAGYFQRAMNGALGMDHALIERRGQTPVRAFTFAAPVFHANKPAGAVIVRVDMETIEESDWRGDPQAIFFTDEAGVIFVSNRSELLLRARNLPASDQGEDHTLLPFVAYQEWAVRDHRIWVLDAGRYLPRRAIYLSQPLPVIGLTGEALVNTAPAERIATLQAAVAAALCLAFGALLYLATERRRTLALANHRLEARVANRTRELTTANESLRHEVLERQEAEAALKRAQAELVQAGKLSALGKMSAGISHELNQPLMAIRSFAENAETFLEREDTQAAAGNLSRISELARRMGRIIKNLRAFAKQESEPISDVDIIGVVNAVLELAEARIVQDNITLTWQPPDAALFVRGGEVRLQQVVMNLISNAMDAMVDSAEKRLDIEVTAGLGRAFLRVRDSGPGIESADKIFDPFYSTKEVGQSEGMGLGLSISYGLVQSFGGVIRGQNHAEGGAVFTVELNLSEQVVAA